MDDKVKGILAWALSLVGGLIFLFMKDSSAKVKMHAAQSLVAIGGLIAIDIVLGILGIVIPFLGIISWLAWVLYLVCYIMGIVRAAQDGDPELPVLADVAKSIFKKQLEV